MATKVLLKDKNENVILPITRGELVLDSSGKVALHSEEFLATEEKPGLMSSSDKAKLDSVAGGAIDDKLDINSSNPVLNKVLTQIINSIKEKYLKSVSVINNKLTITDQDDNDVDFFGSIYSIVTDTTDGLVPKFDSVDGTIDDQSEDWILTNHKGNLGWYKLPLSTFTQNTASLYIGDDVSESNTSTTNGSTYLKFFENSELKHKYKIQGSGSTVITSDSNGNLNIYNPTTFASNQIDKLTDYVKGTSVESLKTTDTLNQALGKLEYKADVTYNLVRGAYDGDGTIENLEEILKVLEGIKDTETIQSIIGKYLPLSGGTMLGSITINHDYNSGDAKIIYKNNRLNDNQTGGWADNIIIHTNASETTTARIGVLGDKKDLSYLFLGHYDYNATNNLRIYNDHASFGNNMIYNNYISVPLILIIGDLHPHIYGNNGILTLGGKNSLTEGSVVCDSKNNAFRRNSDSTNITLGTNTYRWGNFFGTTGNFTGKITFPLNTGIYYNDLYGLLGVASKGNWTGHPGNDNYYTFIGTPSYDTILRAKATLLVYRDSALRTIVDSGNVSQFALPYIEITSKTDVNTLLQNCIYNVKAQLTNAPVTNWGTLLTMGHLHYTVLTYWPDSGSDIYIRRIGVLDSTKTTNWRRLLHTGDLNPSEVYTNSNQFCGYTTASNTDTRYYCICETTLPVSNNLTLSFYISRTHSEAKQKGILQVHFRNDGGNLVLYDWSMPLNIGLNKSDFILTYKSGLIIKLYVKISGSWKSYECSVLTNSSWGLPKNFTKFYSSSSNSLTSLPSDETVVSNTIADCSVPLSYKLSNFYSSRPSNLKPLIIGDGSMYQFKSTSAASSLTDYPGDGHILNFEWDNDGGYSSQLFIRNHDGLLKTRGMNGKDANGNAKWSLWTTLLSNYNYNNLLPVKLVNGLGYSDMIAAGYLRSDYVSAGYPPEDYLKALCLLLINSYKGYVCIGSVRPSTGGSYICYVYDTTINTSTGLPEYMVGTAFLFNGLQISFGTVSGAWYYRQTLNSTNYSNYTLPRLESMQFAKTSTYVNATLVDPEVRKLALGSGYIEFWDSAVSPNTSGYFNSVWGKVKAVTGFEGNVLSLGDKNLDDSRDTYGSGLTVASYHSTYTPGWPGNYGEIITVGDLRKGYLQIAGAYNVNHTSTNTNVATEMYIRSWRDANATNWSDWTRVLSDRNYKEVLDNAYIKYINAESDVINNTNNNPVLINAQNSTLIENFGHYWNVFNMGSFTGNNHRTLLAMPYINTLSDSELFLRSANGSSWRSWRRVLHTGNYKSIIQRKVILLGGGTSIKSAGWYRCATIIPDKRTIEGNVIISLLRSYNSPEDEHYIFSLSSSYHSPHTCITQLSGYSSPGMRLITKVRLVYGSQNGSGGPYYFDFYYNGESYSNSFSVEILAGDCSSIQTPTLINSSESYYAELTTTNGVASNYGFTGTFTGNLEGKASKIALNRTDGGPTYGDYGEIIQSTSYGPTGSWHNSLKILHNNSAGYYTQLALTFTGEEGLWHRRCTAGTVTEWKKVIDSSNIGSQSVSHATTTERFKLVISNSGDLNTALSSGGLARNYNSGMATGFTNAPAGSSYGMVLQLTAFANSNALAGQLAWDVNHNSTTDTTRYLWWRAGDSVSGFTKSAWHKIAFTDACLSINKKINIGGGSELVPITDVITKTGGYSLTKTLFYYAGNGYTTATKPDGTDMANLDLAGASILTFGASDGEYTHLFITAPTQAGHNGITNEMLFYLNHGSGYSPGWTRVLTNRNYESIVVGYAGVGNSDFTDGTQLLSSYASDSGFSSSSYVNKIYKRNASSMFNYIKIKAAVDENAFTSYTSKYLKVYTKSDSLSYPLLFAGGLGSSSGTDRGIYTASLNTLYYNPNTLTLTTKNFAGTADASKYLKSNSTSNFSALTYYTASGISETLTLGSGWCKPSGVDSDGNSMIIRIKWNSGNYGHDIYAGPNSEELWHRNTKNTSCVWRKIIDTGNIGSQSIGYATNAEYLKIGIKSDNVNYPLVFAEGMGSSDGTYRSICTDSVSSVYYNPSSNILTSSRFASTVATGTAPMTVSSTTVVTNLNADMVDGKHASDFAIPVGTIVMWAGSTAPANWLICDGSDVNRTTYSALFTVIGTTYGSGNGSTTFNLPNLKRKFPLGALTGSFTAGRTYYYSNLGSTGGTTGHTLTVPELPSHNHTATTTLSLNLGSYRANASVSNSYNNTTGAVGTELTATTTIANTGGNSSHNNMPPYLAVNFIIKYQ